MIQIRVIVLSVLLALVGWLSWAVLAYPPRRTPLTLPAASAAGGLGFFGACVEGDDFVFCLDKSASMGWTGTLDIVQEEMVETLLELSPPTQFTVLAFSSNYLVFATTLVQATPDNVANAVAWVSALSAEGATCMVTALGTAIGYAEYSLGNGVVLLVSDGTDTCSGSALSAASVVAAVEPLNPNDIPIHTFYVAGAPDGPDTLIALADAFGGVFVDTTLPEEYFRRGDITIDGSINIADAVFLLAYGFIPGSPAPVCEDAADADDDGVLDPLADSIYLLQSLFVATAPPLPPPVVDCDADPTADALGCEGACPW